MSPTGAILDIDGTLVDSNDAHAHAWVDALAETGRSVPFEKVRRMIGMGGDRVLPELTGLSEDSPEGKHITERRTQIFNERYLPAVRAFPHAHDLLERMHRAGLKLAVATSAKPDEVDRLLAIAGANGMIPRRATSGDVESSKPAPDVVGAALASLQTAPEDTVMIGDTPYDVESGNRAGVAVIALCSGGWSAVDLGGAAAIYKDPADLLEHYDTSPLRGGSDG